MKIESLPEGPFARNLKYPKIISETFQSAIFAYSEPGLVVKERKSDQNHGFYNTVSDALETAREQERMRDKFTDFLVVSGGNRDSAPPVSTVIYDSHTHPGQIAASWVSHYYKDSQPLGSLPVKEIINLSKSQLLELRSLVKADQLMLQQGFYMDIIGSGTKSPPLMEKLTRWPVAVLWSKNIIIDPSSPENVPVFIDREIRTKNQHMSLKNRLISDAYPLRLHLSYLLLSALITAK